jgi:methionine synthase I (cobalamin-dependent)
LDEGDADDLARHQGRLRRDFPHLNVFGGCCGTDAVHVGKILTAVQPERAAAF